MIGEIGRIVGGEILTRSAIAGIGAAALAAPLGVKLRQRRVSRHEARRKAAVGAGSAAVAAPIGLGAAATVSRLRKRRPTHRRRSGTAMIGVVGAAVLTASIGAKLLSRRRRRLNDARGTRIHGADDRLERSLQETDTA